MLACTPENFRSEMARHRLSREAVGSLIAMHPNELSMFLTGARTLTDWAAHNIGWAINVTTRMMIFNVDMKMGPVQAPRGRPGPTVRLDTLPRRKRTRRFRPSKV